MIEAFDKLAAANAAEVAELTEENRQLQKALAALLEWEAQTGGWEAPCWAAARQLLGTKPTQKAERPRLYVVLDGGLVTDICTPHPKFFDGVECIVIDYDVEGADEDDLGFVEQDDGDWARAYVSFHGSPSQATVEPLLDAEGYPVKGEAHPLAPVQSVEG